jgi:hypothetical protein
MKAAMLCIGILVGVALTGAIEQRSGDRYPWLQPAQPTQVEWLALEKQATDGQNNFGEDGMTINFYVAPESLRTGVILCDISYTPQVSAAFLQLKEDSIRRGFEKVHTQYPWAQVKITAKRSP